jgi:hypothetical protein
MVVEELLTLRLSIFLQVRENKQVPGLVSQEQLVIHGLIP